ncbi:hypothetical protein [uncultured Flavobacterium sp.]|uniref:hypothetical protein n=1 Tax=uncultured Flavobacterium sp. TaxID=165435 RepID=UPI0025F226B4|nr:hypothetical protein [uncultured Flavobacterium sp.]
MAKIYSNEKIPKRIGDYVTYAVEGKGYHVLQLKTGFTKEKMESDLTYDLCLKNSNEFALVSSLCKKIRYELRDLLPKKNNGAICNSLTSIMRKALVFDTVSVRGERNLGVAFGNEPARELLTGYDFNPFGVLPVAFRDKFFFDLDAGLLQFSSFKAAKLFTFPDGDFLLGIRLHHLRFDFEEGNGILQSSDWLFFGIDYKSKQLSFKMPANSSQGVGFYILEIDFFHNENGTLLPQNNSAAKSVCIIGVSS